MNKVLFDNMSEESSDPISQNDISTCSICGASFSSKLILCPNCGPPFQPSDEPEETGISFKQALLRITI